MSSEVFHDWLIFFNLQCDIDNPQVDMNQLDDFCSKHNISGWWVKTKGIYICLPGNSRWISRSLQMPWQEFIMEFRPSHNTVNVSNLLYYYGKSWVQSYSSFILIPLCVCVCVCTHNRNMHLILSLPVLHVCGLQQRLNGPIRGCWGYTCVCTAVS